MIDDIPIGAGLSRDIATSKKVEAEIDAMISRRHDKRVLDEGERDEEAAWAASVRRHSATNAQALLEDQLRHAQAMHRAHTKTFGLLLEKWVREIDRCEELLGINRRGRRAG